MLTAVIHFICCHLSDRLGHFNIHNACGEEHYKLLPDPQHALSRSPVAIASDAINLNAAAEQYSGAVAE